jgi:hypothetical protein
MRRKVKDKIVFLGKIATIAIGVILLASIGIVWIGGAIEEEGAPPVSTYVSSPGPDIPHLLNYQGVLTDSAGDPVPDGTYQMTFGIYDSATDGNLLWSETQPNVQVSDGLYNVLLGSVNPIPADVFCGGADRWLGMKVGSDAEMTPRQRIVSVAYAYAAECAQGIAPGHGLVIKDTDGNVTHRLNANGTSWHNGLETFNGGIELTYVHSPQGWTVKYGTDGVGTMEYHYDQDGVLRYEKGCSGVMGVEYSKTYDGEGNLVREERTDLDTGTKKVYDGDGNLVREYNINGDSSQTGTSTWWSGGTGEGYWEVNNEGIAGYNAAGDCTWSGSSPYGGIWTTGNGWFDGNLGCGGTKNAVVETENYGNRATYCEESTEIYFFDRGESRLVNGEVTVELDPIFLETVTINETYLMLVQLTLTSDCNGVFVAQRTASNFTVRELNGGNSNAGFMWEAAAKRKGYEDTRLEEWSE